jgi:hypothetical protein
LEGTVTDLTVSVGAVVSSLGVLVSSLGSVVSALGSELSTDALVLTGGLVGSVFEDPNFGMSQVPKAIKAAKTMTTTSGIIQGFRFSSS